MDASILTFQFSLGGLLDGILDLIISDRLLKTASQIYNGDVGGRHAHGHSSELAIELRNHLSDRLCRTGAAGDDILSGGTSTTPVLSRGAIDCLLRGRVRMNRGHQTLDNRKFVMYDLGERSETIGRTGSIGDDLDV